MVTVMQNLSQKSVMVLLVRLVLRTALSKSSNVSVLGEFQLTGP